MRSTESRLKELAGDDEHRLSVLAGRKERSKSRSRAMRCVTCDNYSHDTRDSRDCCDECLAILWGAQSVLDGEYSKAKNSGLMPVMMTMTAHDLPYPHLNHGYNAMPADAVFSVERYGRNEDSPSSVMQVWFLRLFEELGKALPCDPESQRNASALLRRASGWDNNLYARLPVGAVEAINALWHFICWQSDEAFRFGFEKGRNMLSDMNLGHSTFEKFTNDVAEQTKRLQKDMDDHAAGKFPAR